jgi:hypothetical protein
MRSCRRFLAGIPHCGVGHPCVTHPSATPFLRRAFDLHVLGTPPAFILSQDQTRHPCSISPHHAPGAWCGQCTSAFELRSRPSCHCLHLAVRRCVLHLSPERQNLIDRNCCVRVRVHPVAVLLSTLQLSRCYQKQVLLASLPPFEDRYRNPGTTSLHKGQKALGSIF